MPRPVRTGPRPFAQAKERLRDFEPVLRRIALEVVFPAFGRNYERSGLRKRTGVLKATMTRPGGGKGQVYRVSGNTLEVGVDPAVLKYAKYVVEGRGPVVAKRAKVLRFYDEHGKVIFRKRVGPSRPHTLFYLLPEDLDRAGKIVADMLGSDWTVRFR